MTGLGDRSSALLGIVRFVALAKEYLDLLLLIKRKALDESKDFNHLSF